MILNAVIVILKKDSIWIFTYLGFILFNNEHESLTTGLLSKEMDDDFEETSVCLGFKKGHQ